MDEPGHDPAVLAEALDTLRRVNRWLGGTRLTLQALERLLPDPPPGSPLTILDVATGGADIPRAVLAWARRRGLHGRVVAIDHSLEVLRLAARPAASDLTLLAADACALPFPDRSFDVATCSLVLHHLAPDDAVTMLRELRRVARRGVIVNDLVRGWLGYLGARALGQLATSNPLCRHDGPLSVRRAYTRAEMAALSAQAGLHGASFSGWLGYRVAWTARVAA